MDHYNDDVLILPIFGGPMQVFGYSDSSDWRRYPSAGRLHWLSDPPAEDAPLVRTSQAH